MRIPALTRTALTLTATAILLATLVATPAQAGGGPPLSERREAGQTVTVPLYEAIEQLTEGDEDRTGYVRTAFRHWVDADRDGCDARKEVILAEALVAPTVGPKCALTGGQWLSLYDNITITDASKIDVDHMVPLAEAWDSGASAWTPAERQTYANDLDEPRALIGVSFQSNRSKADKDPAQWLPTATDYRCTYLQDWTAIKTRWNLTVDPAEHNALRNLAADCDNTELTVTLAR
ncbi:HNH endonuclease family protein [Kitasatospora sp. NPDC101801]|uniref:HNH endonuclease family protein n=1 Tax=Kitasatospora sp. NPDC101801 TaxID=3364103 RepID=UPI00382A2FAF